MLTRIYIHNYKCFQNFEFDFGKIHEAVIIGQNGSGKTTLSCVLDILRRIGSGTAMVEELIGVRDFWHASPREMLRIEASFQIGSESYTYAFALELPDGFKKLRVAEETLVVNGGKILSRDRAQVDLVNRSGDQSHFTNDWHEFVLPRIFIQDGAAANAVKEVRAFLSNILVLRPIPDDMGDGMAVDETHNLQPRCANFEDWLCCQYAELPDVYDNMKTWLKESRPLQDFTGFKANGSRLLIRFKAKDSIDIPFSWLSSGEKIFFLAAAVMAVNDCRDRPVLCFWDEPDNYLSLSEIGRVMASLRHCFASRGQLIITSHSDEAISKFTDENVFHLMRNSHLEPTLPMQSVAQRKKDMELEGEKETLLLTGDLEG